MIQYLKRMWRLFRHTRKLEVHEIRIHTESEVTPDGDYFQGKLTVELSPEASAAGSFYPRKRTWYVNRARTRESADAKLKQLFINEGWCWTRDTVKALTAERFYIPPEHTEHTEHTS